MKALLESIASRYELDLPAIERNTQELFALPEYKDFTDEEKELCIKRGASISFSHDTKFETGLGAAVLEYADMKLYFEHEAKGVPKII